jgi:hypothetical protein
MTIRASRDPRLLFLAGALSAVVGCGRAQDTTAPPASATAAPRAAAATGRIRGIVTLQGNAPRPRTEVITKDPGVCGQATSLTRITLGPGNGVGQAFVYLDGVPNSENVRPRVATEIKQEGCSFGPHVMTLPAGSDLEIVNNDPVLHNTHAREATTDGLQTVFNIAQPIRGQRTKVEAALNKPGVIALTCEAGHPWMTAYILVAGHPYVATTNGAGEFTIDNVPAGSYPITMWHEGVQIKEIFAALQRYEYEEPYQITKEVVVAPGGEAVVNFSFAIRPTAS